jgi:hypothetical protein
MATKTRELLVGIMEADLGVEVRLTEGFRTYEQQDWYYAQGRTRPGPIITSARGGESYHNFGVAVDLALFDQSGRYLASDVAYRYVGRIGQRLGLTWGGVFGDPSHFQLDQGISVRTMRSRFEAGWDVFTGR